MPHPAALPRPLNHLLHRCTLAPQAHPSPPSAPPPAACCLQVLLYPSKSQGMFVPESLIFRSDSNGEDLAVRVCVLGGGRGQDWK